MTVLAALCHEGGHLAGLRLAGARVEAVRLTAFGAEIRADTRYLPYGREILCTLAGPAVNLVLALLFARALGWYLPAGVNLFLGCFNLLPLPGLDGGRALYLGVSWLAGPEAADRVCQLGGAGVRRGPVCRDPVSGGPPPHRAVSVHCRPWRPFSTTSSCQTAANRVI